MKESSYSENVSFVEKEADHTSAVRSILHFQGDDLIVQRQQDMEPVLQHVQRMREENERMGSRWGEGRRVGHIPAIDLPAILSIKGHKERGKAARKYLREKSKLSAFDAFLRR